MKQYDGPSTFFYLDPPYYKTALSEYNHKYIDIVGLRDYLKTIKGKFLLSYNNDPYILDLFQDFNIKQVKTRYCIKSDNNNIEAVELLISNYTQ